MKATIESLELRKGFTIKKVIPFTLISMELPAV